MKSDAFLELRILSGTHAGARALVPERPQVVGSGPDCDWILSDEGVLARHARLELQADGSAALHWLEGEQPPAVIQPGEGVALGSVLIAIEPANAPWRTEVPLCEAQRQLHEPPAHDAPQATDTVLQEARGLAASARAGGLAGRPRARLATLAGLVAATAGLAWWAGQAAPDAQGPATSSGITAVPSPAPPGRAANGIEAVRTVLADLGLAERVRLEPRDGLPPVLHAGLLSQDESEALGAALSRLSPRPRLQLASAEDLQVAVTDALQQQGADRAKPLSARYLGDGRFAVSGRVADDAEAATVLSRMAAQFPQVRAFESALVTDAAVAQAMVDDLRAQGLPEVTSHWSEGVLSLEVRLPQAAVPRWEKALQAVASRHSVPFRARVELVAPVVAAASLPASALPFSVRSIVSSGALPYVVLASGDKLVQDGSVQGWRLTQVQARSVVFEGANGRRVTLER